MRRITVGLLVWVGLAGGAWAQTLDAERLTVGGTLSPPSGTTVRLDGLGTSGGTNVLFTDADGDVFERLLAASDIPAGFARTDTANTWSLLQTFTSGLTSNGLLTIGGSNDLLLGTGGMRVASGSINLRNIADNANIATFGDAAISLVQPVSMSSTLGVTGLTTLAKAKTTGLYAVSAPLLFRNAADSATVMSMADAGLSITGTLGVSGNTTLTGDLAVNGGDLTSTGVLTIRPTGNLTLDPTGDIVMAADGNDILPDTGYTKNLGALSNKYLTLHAAELWVETLVAQNTIATIGGRVLVGPTTVLTADLAAAATSISVKHNQMASGDRVYLEADGKVEFMAIASAASGAGPYTYTVTRNLDGSGANDWYAGDAMFNTGTTGDGFIDLYSVSGVLSGAGPTIVGNVRTGTTYSNVAPRWAIGNLNALYGYSGDVYGAAFGDQTDVWIGVDATNGIRIFEGGSTQRAVWATDGSLTIGSAATNSGNVHISSDAILLRSGTTTRMQLAASNGELTMYDPAGTAMVNVASGFALFGQQAAAKGNIYMDTSSGIMAFRTNTTNRIYIDGDTVRLFDPTGVRRSLIGSLTGSGSTLSGYGFVFGDSSNAGQMFLEYGSTSGDMNFCVAGDTCYLNFDGATGDITSSGDILLSTGGNITSTGNFTLSNSGGLRMFQSSGDIDAARSVTWDVTGATKGAVSLTSTGRMLLSGGYEATSGGVFIAPLSVNYYDHGLHVTKQSGAADTVVYVRASAASANVTAQILPQVSSGTGSATSALGSDAARWGALYVSDIYASGNQGQTTTITVRDSAGTGTCTIIFTDGVKTGGTC